MTAPRQPFWARCEPCGHCWAPAYAPMELGLMAKLLKAVRCPMCGNGPKNIAIAKQDSGILNEPGWTADGVRTSQPALVKA